MRGVWLGVLALVFLGTAWGAQEQQNVPNAPAPQAQSVPPNAPTPRPQATPLPDLKDTVTPGKGAGVPVDETDAGQTAPHISSGTVGAEPQAAPPPDNVQKTPPEMPLPGQQGPVPTIVTNYTIVDVPVTVRDKHGNLIGGLPWWRFRVYEDGVRQRIAFFTTDAYPLSIAFVIDATLPADVMQKVNRSLSVLPGALTPADTVAVITYAGTSPQLVTDFTGAEGARLSAALEMAKKPGQPMGVPIVSGPFAEGPMVNGESADPTLAPNHTNSMGFVPLPREAHPLNDAILYAAEQLASQPRGRRRIIYVISDGKNVRSKASFKEVLQYLLTNNISVYGTNVGDTALWGIGYLDRTKLPFLNPEDLLPQYALRTGGDVDHELSENGIQNAFVHITDSVRTAYTLDYVSHQPTISGKYHSIDVRVEGLTGLQVDAKQGYYPAASDMR
jgi:VWFA-related protein